MIAVILAGGTNSRIGVDKLLLPVAGQPMIHRIVAILGEVFDQIVVVGQRRPCLERLRGVSLVEDRIRGVGPMGGIYTGLQCMEDEYGFFVACDMPFLDPAIIRKQAEWAQEGVWDAIVPRHGKYLEPLHAVYSKACLKPLSVLIGQGIYRIRSLYDEVNVRYLDIESEEAFRRAFCNINTPEAWYEIEQNPAQFKPACSTIQG